MANLTSLLLEYITSPEQAAQLIDILKQNYSLGNGSDSQILLRLVRLYLFKNETPHIVSKEHNGLSDMLLLYLSPLLLVLGTIGNILAFIVLVKNAHKVSTYHYLYVLAVMDILLLMTNLLQVWIKQLTGVLIQDEAAWLCKLFVFVGFFSSDASVWLIITVTVERLIAVQLPLKTSMICTQKRTKFSIIGVLAAIASVNAHFLWTMDLQPTNSSNVINGMKCVSSPKYAKLINNVWPWVDAIIYSFLPFVTISVVNFIIVNTVCAARRRREGLLLTSKQKKIETRRANSKLTVMLLVLSFSFLFLTLPMNIMMIAAVFWNKEEHSQEEISTFQLVRTVTELLMYTNHTINFILYFVTGQRFRQQFCKIIIPCKTSLATAAEYDRTQFAIHNMKGFTSSDTSRTMCVRLNHGKSVEGQYV